ncbi:hypothetical protein BGX38DRAFT_109057 [Terfezia claveryi]|nr:hypothetical protein BGX38DRAFT_109057 [Terfezia claveryi]
MMVRLAHLLSQVNRLSRIAPVTCGVIPGLADTYNIRKRKSKNAWHEVVLRRQSESRHMHAACWASCLEQTAAAGSLLNPSFRAPLRLGIFAHPTDTMYPNRRFWYHPRAPVYVRPVGRIKAVRSVQHKHAAILIRCNRLWVAQHEATLISGHGSFFYAYSTAALMQSRDVEASR